MLNLACGSQLNLQLSAAVPLGDAAEDVNGIAETLSWFALAVVVSAEPETTNEPAIGLYLNGQLVAEADLTAAEAAALSTMVLPRVEVGPTALDSTHSEVQLAEMLLYDRGV